MNSQEKTIAAVALGMGGGALLYHLMGLYCKAKHSRPSKADPLKKSDAVVNQPLVDFVVEKGTRTSEEQKELLAETIKLFPTSASMTGGAQVGALLNNLIRLGHARRGIEVGVFTGYTTLGMAQALPADGKLLALDVSREYTALGERFWKHAGVAHKIDLRVKPALTSLNELLEDPANHASFDFAFVDADKPNYDNYFEKLLLLIKKGGWIAFDNMFAFGYLLSEKMPEEERKSVMAIRAMNEKLSRDQRVDISMLEICDGVFLVVKK